MFYIFWIRFEVYITEMEWVYDWTTREQYLFQTLWKKQKMYRIIPMLFREGSLSNSQISFKNHYYFTQGIFQSFGRYPKGLWPFPMTCPKFSHRHGPENVGYFSSLIWQKIVSDICSVGRFMKRCGERMSLAIFWHITLDVPLCERCLCVRGLAWYGKR